jgi:formylglycine-generating enzyme required for sulfatase activity
MTSVLRNRYVVQLLFPLAVGVVIATMWGCAPRADQDPPGTTTPKPAAVEQPGQETPAAKPAADAPPEETPAEETSTDTTPAEDTPAADAPAEDAPTEEGPAEKEFNPTDVPTVQWLPEPVANPDAEAEDESQMKAYTEEIPETDVTFAMVPIPGGKFMMGSPQDEANREDDEGPQHEVVIEPFWMGKCEVTWDEYELYGVSLDYQRRKMKRDVSGGEPTEREKLVDAIARPTNPYTDMTFGMGREGYPAICMSQLAAKGYCKWLSAKTGRYHRLPTEAEWEYACRAGTTTAYHFGDDPEDLDDYAWHFDNSDDQYHKVGQKKPNPWGLHDMHGNVQELVLDQHIPDYFKQFAGKTVVQPLAVPTTRYPRVVRGGCWDDDPEHLRSAARRGSHQDWKTQDPQIPQSIWYFTEVYCPGFRVVRPLKVPDLEEGKLHEWDTRVIHEYQEAQAGKM